MSELFEICDAHGEALGQLPRETVHRCGAWHKAAHVLLFHSDGRLWLQRRAWDKDIGAGLWDFSVGEHLVPGESFEAGARRGLEEELGLTGLVLEPLGPMTRFRLQLHARGIDDAELQRAFRAVHDGPLHPDPEEVAEVRLIRLDDFGSELGRNPAGFTPWLLHHAERLGLLGGSDEDR